MHKRWWMLVVCAAVIFIGGWRADARAGTPGLNYPVNDNIQTSDCLMGIMDYDDPEKWRVGLFSIGDLIDLFGGGGSAGARDAADAVDTVSDPDGLPDNTAVAGYVAVIFWGEETAYPANQHVIHNGVQYYARQPHTSDTSTEDVNEPGVGTDWEDYWEYANSTGGSAGARDAADVVDTVSDPDGLPDNTAVAGYVAVIFWGEETAYPANQHVIHNGVQYYARQPHTSDTSTEDVNEPGVGTDWEDYWEYANSTGVYPYEIVLGDTRIVIVDLGDGVEQIQFFTDGATAPDLTLDSVNGLVLPPLSAPTTDTAHGDFRLSDAVRAQAAEAIAYGEAVFLRYDSVAEAVFAYLADANDPTRYPAFGLSAGAIDGTDSSAEAGEILLVMPTGIIVDTSWSWPVGVTGTHDGSGDAAILADSGAGLAIDIYIGGLLQNTTDGSSCIVTDNDGMTVACTLSGGTDNDWDAGDAYVLDFDGELCLSETAGDIVPCRTSTLYDTEGDMSQKIGTALGPSRARVRVSENIYMIRGAE